MKLCYDPRRHAVVTQDGHVVENVTNVIVDWSEDYFDNKATITIRGLAVHEIPDVSPTEVRQAIAGLRQIEDDLDEGN